MKIRIYFDGLAILMASAWVGGMWAIGYIAAPVLFLSLPDKALAGMLAGKLFAVMGYMGLVCAVYLLVYDYLKWGRKKFARGVFWVILMMLVILLLGQFGIQPILGDLKQQALPNYVMESAYAGQFRMWHGVSSLMYLAQSLAGAWLLLKMVRCND